jgi:hypothetical protein
LYIHRFELRFYVEKYLRKLAGKTDIEDSLQRLDKLTHEEAQLASAELLKTAHRIEGKVNNGVQDVKSDVRDVGKKVDDVNNGVQGVGDKLDQANRLSFLDLTTPLSQLSNISTGNQLRDNLLRWLSPPDPSTNHNIASQLRHDGTSQWFCQSNIFREWKFTASLLWIHGKRAFLLVFATRPLIDISRFLSGLWQEHT